MSQTELLLKKVEGLSPAYMAQIFDFIDQLTHKAPPAAGVEPFASEREAMDFANDYAERLLHEAW
jgi:hypothetical protein